MSDEQLAAMLKRLDDIERRLSNLELRTPKSLLDPAYPQPQPWQPYDGLPRHWKHDGGARD